MGGACESVMDSHACFIILFSFVYKLVATCPLFAEESGEIEVVFNTDFEADLIDFHIREVE